MNLIFVSKSPQHATLGGKLEGLGGKLGSSGGGREATPASSTG